MKSRLFLLFTLALCLGAGYGEVNAQRRARATAATHNAAVSETAPRMTQTLPIRRVILYSNGVAYVERRGTVTGRAEIDLSFKQSQVDDVLKSMVVLDLGRGRIGAVSYNSSAPPSARLADIPFSIGAATEAGTDGGLAGVLGQMQGARVSVATAGGRTVSGSVITVEERRAQGDERKPGAVTHALVIASDAGELSSFDLSDVRSVRLLDEGARRDLGEFARATASARRRDAKTITVTSDGAGAREMLVSYTVAAPIWKTTYRVVLGADGEPFFQGWAIVDNVSEEDWDGIQLSLISGTPVSFIQPIQQPLYRYRPVIPVPGDLNLSPQTYESETGENVGGGGPGGGVGGGGGPALIMGRVTDPLGAVVPGATVTAKGEGGGTFNATVDSAGTFRISVPAGTYSVSVSGAGFKAWTMTGLKVGMARPAHVNVALEVGAVSETVTVTAQSIGQLNTSSSLSLLSSSNSGVDGAEAGPSVGELIAGGESGVEAAARGDEVGDFFEYRIAQPVTVRRDRSALIPILQTRMEGERVSVFREEGGRTRPMSGLMLRNTSELTLEGGALTVVDGDAYAGESLLERLKPGERRLVTFALDLGTLVTVRETEDDSPVFAVRILNGTLYATHHHRERKTYTLRNQTDRPRTVYVEHPVREDWQLDDKLTPAPDGKTENFYRFKVEVPPNETRQLVVAEREQGTETFEITNITPQQLRLFVARRYLDDASRAALENILELKARLAAAEARAEAADRETEEIGADQKRLRENIESLNKTAEARGLITRYVQKADQQETRLEQLAREKQAAEQEKAQLQTQLDAAIRALALKRDLAMNE
ncbi:MAG TPA: carboxypeptidase regulatory-like domain-containing protein [Pyrinomonadaceae bacterium]|nr:carboxypeptidase regulatory-like domain-containing protein [Pyrinomonadaceae bacterium]